MMVQKNTVTQTLHGRRAELAGQLDGILARRGEALSWLRASEEAWRVALAAGGDCDQEIDARRTAEAEVAELDRSAEQVGTWLAEVDREIAAKAPHDALDAESERYTADVAAFAERVQGLDGQHSRSVDVVAEEAAKLHRMVKIVQRESEELAARGWELRNRATQLQRTDGIPDVPDWQRPLELATRGTELWGLYLLTIQRNPAEAVATALANTARHRMIHRAH